MSTAWLVVAAVGLGTVLIKASGPVLFGGRPLPAPVARIVPLLGPALLAALVSTAAFGGERGLVVDARAMGLAAAAVALGLRAPILVVVVVAAAVAALARLGGVS